MVVEKLRGNEIYIMRGKMKMSNVYFHEDDYCQIEILPIENLEFCMKQAGLINEFSGEHWTGSGWTDMFVRNENPISVHEKRILAVLLEKALECILLKFDEVHTGYGSHCEKCNNIKAFGQNENVVIFYSEKDTFVDNIWLNLNIHEENDIALAKNMLTALSTLGNFIIADWGWDFVKEIKCLEDIEHYLRKRLEVFSGKQDMSRYKHNAVNG